MRILTLPVDDSIADGYYNAAPEKKDKINSIVNIVLSKFLKEKEDSSLSVLIKEMSDEAEKNGLTIERLGEIMDWDEETIKNLFGKTPA